MRSEKSIPKKLDEGFNGSLLGNITSLDYNKKQGGVVTEGQKTKEILFKTKKIIPKETWEWNSIKEEVEAESNKR